MPASLVQSEQTVQVTAQLELQFQSWLKKQATGQVVREMALIICVMKAEISGILIQNALNLKSRANFKERYLMPALAFGLIEMTIPDKPNSRLQTYRLTEDGRSLLRSAANGERD